MKILSEKKILKVSLRYDLQEKDNVFDYLDKAYGEEKYRVTRSGPVVDGCDGLMIVEVEL